MVVLFMSTLSVFGGSHVLKNDDPLIKIFIKNIKKMPDAQYQQMLRSEPAWQSFISKYPGWGVTFNEENQMPHRAYGNAINTAVAGTPQEVALKFMQTNLNVFNLPFTDIRFKNANTSKKFSYVHFNQQYKGLNVMWSDAYFKLTLKNEVVMFGLDVYNNIDVDITPTLDNAKALAAASADIKSTITKTTIGNALSILPIPQKHSYDFRLVYEITIDCKDEYKVPAKYYTLVDAHTGEILYRTNEINHVGNTDVNVSGTFYPTHNYNPSQYLPLRNMKIFVNNTNTYTDVNGNVSLTNTAPVAATIKLEGLWSKTQTNGVVATLTTTLNPGTNNINFDATSNIKEMSAYMAVNVVHDYMKTKFPSFTNMDNPLETNIDEQGTCNAFYNGSSINFFDAGGGCEASSTVADVCYHEYGHGINDKYYQSIGGSFGNGALGEGYADIWALGITDSPILGIGFFQNNATGYVRRYDINKKIYPQDLVGEVHSDGEIIAGAWWDYGLYINDRQLAVDLFAETFNAALTAPSGQEGSLYTDVLIEAITSDDDDNNLSNGTPHLSDLTDAFGDHGIYLVQNVNFTHAPVAANIGWQPITVNAVLSYTSQFPWYTLSGVGGFYKVNNIGPWIPFTMPNVGGNNYSGTIPGQPSGTIISYYLNALDNSNNPVSELPFEASAPNPNIPYYILVGYTEIENQDFDNLQGNWEIGIPSDDATTGMFEVNAPAATFTSGGAICQTGTQTTPGGFACVMSQADPGTVFSQYDIDNGSTTVISPPYDLTSYNQPAFTFQRWYTNDQGSNPGKDYWKVYISNDGGVTYLPVENTNIADHSWRRFAFRVSDYLVPNNNVTVKFVASDIPQPGATGAIVEAALDDLILWDGDPLSVNELTNISAITIAPNPVNDLVTINWQQQYITPTSVRILDATGRVVYEKVLNAITGSNNATIDLSNVANGIYQLQLNQQQVVKASKISVVH